MIEHHWLVGSYAAYLEANQRGEHSTLAGYYDEGSQRQKCEAVRKHKSVRRGNQNMQQDAYAPKSADT